MNKLPTFSPVVRDLDKQSMTVKIGMDKRSISVMAGRFAEYKSLPEKLRPAMEEIGDYVRTEMIPYVFNKEGPGWKPLAARTRGERQAQGYGPGHPILIRTRDLFKELTEKQHPKHVEVVKVGKNARIEIGGSSQKFIENQLGKRSQRLPARPMIPGTGTIPLRDKDKQQMMKIIENNYRRILNRPT